MREIVAIKRVNLNNESSLLSTVKSALYVHVVLEPVFISEFNWKCTTEGKTEDSRPLRHLTEYSDYLLRFASAHVRNNITSVLLDVKLHKLGILDSSGYLLKHIPFVYFIEECL